MRGLFSDSKYGYMFYCNLLILALNFCNGRGSCDNVKDYKYAHLAWLYSIIHAFHWY